MKIKLPLPQAGRRKPMSNMLRCNAPLKLIEKYLVKKTKPIVRKSNNPEEQQEIFERTKKSLPDLLILKEDFFKGGNNNV